MKRGKEFFFTKNTYIGVGCPAATEARSGNYKGAEVVSAIGGDITLVFVPSEEHYDNIYIYLTAADAYELGKLLMERAELASQELLEINLEKR